MLKPLNVRVDTALLSSLSDIREQTGIPVSEQIRRALAMWIENPQRKRQHAFIAKIGGKRQAVKS